MLHCFHDLHYSGKVYENESVKFSCIFEIQGGIGNYHFQDNPHILIIFKLIEERVTYSQNFVVEFNGEVSNFLIPSIL